MRTNFTINKQAPFKDGYIFVTRRFFDDRLRSIWSAENDKEIIGQVTSVEERRKNPKKYTVNFVLDYLSRVAKRNGYELHIYRFEDIITHLSSLPPEVLKEAESLQWITINKKPHP